MSYEEEIGGGKVQSTDTANKLGHNGGIEV